MSAAVLMNFAVVPGESVLFYTDGLIERRITLKARCLEPPAFGASLARATGLGGALASP